VRPRRRNTFMVLESPDKAGKIAQVYGGVRSPV
jgi:reverse gyrase